MSEFTRIFKKVNGLQKLKEYLKAHVLLYSLFQTALNGTSKKGLEIVRLAVNNRIYQRIKKKNKAFISDFKTLNKDNLGERKREDIIWICWFQGIENAPYMVKKCFESIKSNIKDKKIVVITDDNYLDYVTFPDYISEKYEKGIISKTHFSDLLRLELLNKYGGTWIDATVYCTGTSMCDYALDSDLFFFQNLKPGLNGDCLSISSWFMTASTNNPVIMLTRELLYNYWKSHNYLIDYFLLHMFFQMALETYPEEWQKVIPFSNSTPHILLLRLFEPYDEKIWLALSKMTDFHKLSYKYDEKQTLLENTYYKNIICEKEPQEEARM